MSGESKEAWAEVDRRFSEFGRLVAERYRKAEGGRAPAEETGNGLEGAFSNLTRQLDRVFASVGDTIRDPEAKESFKHAGKAVLVAFGSTANEVGEEIRKRRPGSKGKAPEEG